MKKNYILKQNTSIKNINELLYYLNNNFIPQIELFIYEKFKINIKFNTPIIQIGQMENENKQILNYFLITDDILINNLKIFDYIPNNLNIFAIISIFLVIPIVNINKKFEYTNQINFDIEFDFYIKEALTDFKIKKIKENLKYNILENILFI